MTDRYDSDFVDILIFGLKTCPTCEVPKPRNTEHFDQDVSTADELYWQCRECLSAAQLGHRKSQADYERTRYQTDPEYRERRKASARKANQKRRAAA